MKCEDPRKEWTVTKRSNYITIVLHNITEGNGQEGMDLRNLGMSEDCRTKYEGKCIQLMPSSW